MTKKSELSFQERRKATNRRFYVNYKLERLRIEYGKRYPNDPEKVERQLHYWYPRLFGDKQGLENYLKYSPSPE